MRSAILLILPEGRMCFHHREQEDPAGLPTLSCSPFLAKFTKATYLTFQGHCDVFNSGHSHENQDRCCPCIFTVLQGGQLWAWRCRHCLVSSLHLSIGTQIAMACARGDLLIAAEIFFWTYFKGGAKC